jgi:alpha-amylase
MTLTSLATGFHPRQNITEILSCQFTQLDDTGDLEINLHDGDPRIYYPTDSLHGSDLCGFSRESMNSTSGASPSVSVCVGELDPLLVGLGVAVVTALFL